MIHFLEWLRAEDIRLFRDVYGANAGALAGAMIVVSVMGGAGGAAAIAPLLFARRTRPFAIALASLLIVTAITVAGVKQLVGRPRPLASLDGVHAIGLPAFTDPSFPSGHAAGAFAFAFFVAVVMLSRRPRTPLALATVGLALMFAFAVALSRVYLGFHYPIDVACGAILGAALGALAGRRHARRL